MADKKFSDTSGKPLNKDLCYKVTVYSYGNKVRINFDTELTKELKELIQLAKQNNCVWEEWDSERKKYIPIESPQEPKTPPV